MIDLLHKFGSLNLLSHSLKQLQSTNGSLAPTRNHDYGLPPLRHSGEVHEAPQHVGGFYKITQQRRRR